MGGVIFDKATRAMLEIALEDHKTNPDYAALRAKAAEQGYRLAEVWEREHLKREDLYSWCGTLWVRLDEHPDPQEGVAFPVMRGAPPADPPLLPISKPVGQLMWDEFQSQKKEE